MLYLVAIYDYNEPFTFFTSLEADLDVFQNTRRRASHNAFNEIRHNTLLIALLHIF